MRNTLVKQPAEVRIYSMPFLALMKEGDTLAGVVSVVAVAQGWVAGSGALTIDQQAVSGSDVQFRAANGTDGELYLVTVTATTTGGETLETEGYLLVRNSSALDVLVSFADLKSILGLTQNSLDDYPDLQVILWLVRGAIEDHLGRDLDYRQRTETHQVLGRSAMIPLVGLPVESVASVTVDGSTWDSSFYRITPYGLKLAVPVTDLDVVVTYTGGMKVIPDTVARAALLQTVYEFQGKAHIGAQSVTTEGGTVNRPALRLLAEVRDRLAHFVQPLTRLL